MAELFFHVLEVFDAVLHNADCACGRELLTDSAYAATRAAGAEVMAFEDDDSLTRLGEVIACGASDDAAADDQDVSLSFVRHCSINQLRNCAIEQVSKSVTLTELDCIVDILTSFECQPES
jgi:hypothetical protein